MLNEADVVKRMKLAGRKISRGGGFKPDGIKRDSLLNEETTGLDSMDTVDYLLALESEFSCKISDEIMTSMKTVGELVDYLRKHGKT